ncbi:MAG: mannose system component [Tepidanaerobacteraceae bacterium]|nr:mannose system component [Tepidanaerobacteraceae bacterium]
MSDKPDRILTKRDITLSWLLWILSCEVSNSFERLQALSFCISMIPILKKLYKTKEEFCKALARHLQFFNTEGIWGGIVHGITIAMEEQRALNKNIPDEAITGIKTGLMGPFAGIGDTINWATITPIVAAFFVPFAKEGSWIAGFAPVVILGVVTLIEGYFLWHAGYNAGTTSAVRILEAGWINQLILGSSILGLFMMGGLSASLVKVATPLKLTLEQGKVFSIQTDLLDKIIPGILPLLTITCVYLYIEKFQNYTKAVLWLLLIGFTLGVLGIL